MTSGSLRTSSGDGSKLLEKGDGIDGSMTANEANVYNNILTFDEKEKVDKYKNQHACTQAQAIKAVTGKTVAELVSKQDKQFAMWGEKFKETFENNDEASFKRLSNDFLKS